MGQQSDQPVSVLLVDDRPENLLALEAVLEDLHVNIVQAHSGTEALKRLLDQDFGLVLLDVQMPGLDGFETARLIRERERTRHIPIIFVTAINKGVGHVERGYSLGAVDYLFKPFDPEILRAKVATFVDLARKTAELRDEVLQRQDAEAALLQLNGALEARVTERTSALAAANRDLKAEVTERKNTEAMLQRRMLLARLVAEVSTALAGSQPFTETLGQVTGALVGYLDAAMARIWTLDEAAGMLVLQASSGVQTDPNEPYGRIPLGELKVGRIAQDRVPHITNQLLDDATFVNPTWARKEQMVAFAGFPLLLEGRVVGVLAMFARQPITEDATQEIASVAETVAQYIERKRVEHDRERLLRELRESEDTQRFLSDASIVLTESLEFETTLQRLTRLAVPHLADWCALDMINEDGTASRLAIAHSDSQLEALAWELSRRYPPRPSDRSGLGEVLRSGRSELVAEVSDEVLKTLAHDEPHVRLARKVGLESYMIVALNVRGRVRGAISFMRARPGRTYDGTDLLLAEDLARRAATAIDNALLFSEVQAAGRAKDQFLAMLGHELRNPLAPIRNAVELLQARRPSAPVLDHARAVIQRQVDHLSRLVDDLLDVSRITQGRIELRKHVVDLRSIVRQAVETARPTVDAREHDLRIDCPPEPVWVNGDPVRLEQVFTNLLNNAAKYTEPHGNIRLTLACEIAVAERWAVVRLEDTGIGIQPEMLGRVFEVFEQGERALDRSQGGLGLGLSLVRSLTEMHGGSVHAESEGPGHGSVFVARFPLAEHGPSPDEKLETTALHANGAAHPGRGATKPGKVLVVDDNRDAADTLAELLEAWGYEVGIAHDGPAALACVEMLAPDAVLLDIGLPGMDGYEVARTIRRGESVDTERHRALLVAVTGYGQEEDRRKSRAADVDHHLTKPVDLDYLRQLLAQVMGTPAPETTRPD